MAKKESKKVDAKKNKIMEKKVDRICKCILTQEEVLKAGEAIAKDLGDIPSLENEVASIAKTFKSKIAESQSRVERNRILIANKYEYRGVVCTEIKDFTVCKVTITRDDTAEIIENRAMTADERQTKLFGEPDDAENGTKKEPTAE